MVKVVLDGQSLLATLCDVGVARNLYKGRFYTFSFSRRKAKDCLFSFGSISLFLLFPVRVSLVAFQLVMMVFLVFSCVS